MAGLKTSSYERKGLALSPSYRTTKRRAGQKSEDILCFEVLNVLFEG
jgi:hypothetical protein